MPPTRQIRALRNLSVDMEDNPNSGGRSEEARVLTEYVFSAALASEPGNPAEFKQAMESAEAEGWKGRHHYGVSKLRQAESLQACAKRRSASCISNRFYVIFP